MTATAQRRVPPVPGERVPEWSACPAVGPGAGDAEVREASAGLVEAAAAEARAFGAQVRCIHRLWRTARAAHAAAGHQALARVGAGQRVAWELVLGRDLVTDVAAEVGPALRLPAGTARRRVEDAVILAEDLPEVLAALEAGRIGSRQADVMVEQWRELICEAPSWEEDHRPPVEAACRLVADLLERAPAATVAQLRAAARARRAVLGAAAAQRARRMARKHRTVWVEAAEHGTAYLHALLDAPVAVAVQDRLEQLAAGLGAGAPRPDHLIFPPRWEESEDTEDRSSGELRADVLADLLLDGILPQEPGFPRGIRGRVSVLVPAGLLAAENPAGTTGGGGCGAAVLSGYGPISAEVARQLAAGAGAWHRVLTHPVTGVVLDHDRTVYAVPADLRRLVELRDGTCRFPGCRRRAQACEMDHTVAWAAGGPTAEHNLAALCRAHHRIKHRDGALGRWSVRRVAPTVPVPGPDPGEITPGAIAGRTPLEPGAVLEWTSPGGLLHRTVPERHHPGPQAEDPAGFVQVVDPPPIEQSLDPPPDDPTDDPPPF